MIDLFLMSLLQQIRSLLDCAATALSWAHMSNHPSSRNLVFEQEKVLKENVLSIMVIMVKHSIPPFSERPVKFPGMARSDSFPDKHLADLSLSVNKGLALINKSKHRLVEIQESPFASIRLTWFDF